MNQPKIAYFCMEIALEPPIPTYCGGLGMLAGDSVRSAADLNLPFVAVTLVHRNGYLVQELDSSGRQQERPDRWDPARFAHDCGVLATVEIEKRTVQLRVWKYVVRGVHGSEVHVYLLDSDVEGNVEQDRRLTDSLYGGDERHRLAQETILGVGGARSLVALGFDDIHVFHMNEGHAALLTLELVHRQLEASGPGTPLEDAIHHVRSRCVFTTHTPIAAGHDVFNRSLVEDMLHEHTALAFAVVGRDNDSLSMTRLAMALSRYVNGVSLKHGEVTRALFEDARVDAITNGVHTASWASPAHQELFDRHRPNWRADAAELRTMSDLDLGELRNAHQIAKRTLFAAVEKSTGVRMNSSTFTLGFARRSTTYKRPDLLLSDTARLRSIARRFGGLQIVYAGKAHPRDLAGKELIRRVHTLADELAGDVAIAFVPNYDMALGRLITAGVDLWVNTPIPPFEASGTSGMKAAVNGVPSLSVRDGWWIEGCVDGVTGWSIGAGPDVADRSGDAASIYDRLEREIMPLFTQRSDEYACIMRNAIVFNGSYFSTHRMMQEYAARAYRVG